MSEFASTPIKYFEMNCQKHHNELLLCERHSRFRNHNWREMNDQSMNKIKCFSLFFLFDRRLRLFRGFHLFFFFLDLLFFFLFKCNNYTEYIWWSIILKVLIICYASNYCWNAHGTRWQTISLTKFNYMDVANTKMKHMKQYLSFVLVIIGLFFGLPAKLWWNSNQFSNCRQHEQICLHFQFIWTLSGFAYFVLICVYFLNDYVMNIDKTFFFHSKIWSLLTIMHTIS